MNLELAGKVVLITGGSKGIGFACARGFVDEGAIVALAARDPAALAAAAASLGGQPGQVSTHSANLSDASAAAAMVAAVAALHGHIDVLINSAGAARRKGFQDLEPADWRAAMDAKFFPYINTTDAVLKGMIKRGAGSIVNIVGMGGKMAATTHLAGGAANAALMLVSAGMAAACAQHGIRVNTINPGGILTERLAHNMQVEAKQTGLSIEEVRQVQTRKIPMGRVGQPEEVANVALFLASARASYVNGAQIAMDGASTPTVI